MRSKKTFPAKKSPNNKRLVSKGGGVNAKKSPRPISKRAMKKSVSAVINRRIQRRGPSMSAAASLLFTPPIGNADNFNVFETIGSSPVTATAATHHCKQSMSTQPITSNTVPNPQPTSTNPHYPNQPNELLCSSPGKVTNSSPLPAFIPPSNDTQKSASNLPIQDDEIEIIGEKRINQRRFVPPAQRDNLVVHYTAGSKTVRLGDYYAKNRTNGPLLQLPTLPVALLGAMPLLPTPPSAPHHYNMTSVSLYGRRTLLNQYSNLPVFGSSNAMGSRLMSSTPMNAHNNSGYQGQRNQSNDTNPATPTNTSNLNSQNLDFGGNLIRKWENARLVGSCCQFGFRFRYNHLGGQSSQHLQWPNRFSKLVVHFNKLNADIFCMQEVQETHYHEHIKPYFDKKGYGSAYMKRAGDKPDGCATFWRLAQFTAVDVRKVPYLHYKCPVLNKDNVGLIVKLRPCVDADSNDTTSTSRLRDLLIANTHILYNPRRGDTKLAQLAVLIANVKQMLGSDQESSGSVPILTGDYNMEPLSHLYRFIMSGVIHYKQLTSALLSGQEENRSGLVNDLQLATIQLTNECEFTTDTQTAHSKNAVYQSRAQSADLSHNLSLMSVYRHQTTSNNQLECSSYHSRGASMVDYIFYGIQSKQVTQDPVVTEQSSAQATWLMRNVKEGRLRCLERLSLPSMSGLNQTIGKMPNQHTGSDHMPLMARFELIAD